MWRGLQRVRQACDVIFTHGGKWVEFVYSKPKFKKSSFKKFFWPGGQNSFQSEYILFFFFLSCATWHVGSSFPDQ